jgi:hypothetical protein
MSAAEHPQATKPFVPIPTQLPEPVRPDRSLPPEEYAKALEEYERAMKQFWREYTFGANYEENPLYKQPYADNEWEAIKELIL